MVSFSGSANLTMPVTFGSDRPLLPWQREFAIFNTKSAITKLVQLIPQMPAPTRKFSGSVNLMVSVKLWYFCPRGFSIAVASTLVAPRFRRLWEWCFQGQLVVQILNFKNPRWWKHVITRFRGLKNWSLAPGEAPHQFLIQGRSLRGLELCYIKNGWR